MKLTGKKAAAGILMTMAVLLGTVYVFGRQGGSVQAKMAESRVLFISSYSYAWDTVQIQIEGIKNGIEDGVVLDYEFMDTKRVDDETALALFYEGLAYRLSKVEPYDAVILGDDAALRFALKYRDELFKDIPLVFEGVNDLDLALDAAKDPLITGIVESLSVQKNIELGLSIYPEAKRVVGILDDSITGQAERNNFYNHASLFPYLEFSEINTSQLTMEEIKKALAALEENTILIYVVMTVDADGRLYTNKESVELIAEFSSVPALRMVEGGIGWGLLGGNIVSMEKSGEIAAQIVMDIIEGRRQSDEIGVVLESPNIYCIDEVVLKKFGIDSSVLPEDTVFINHDPSYFERNKEALLPVLLIVFLFVGIVVIISDDNRKMRKLTKELELAKMRLEQAAEHDFLTGLPNRKKFGMELQEIIRTDDVCTLMMLDIDNFKGINDSFGHAVGDLALKQVAARLRNLDIPKLTAYRFAGDEFIFLYKGDEDAEVREVAAKCLGVFQTPYELGGRSYEIHGSMGVASYPSDTRDSEQLLVRADHAMYRVKKSGKNAYALYKDVKQ